MIPYLVTGLCTTIVAALFVVGHRRGRRHDAKGYLNAQRFARHVHGPFRPL